MWYDFSGSICPKKGFLKHEGPIKCNSYVTEKNPEPENEIYQDD